MKVSFKFNLPACYTEEKLLQQITTFLEIKSVGLVFSQRMTAWDMYVEILDICKVSKGY